MEKRRILLIDDSEITLQMEKAVLESRGYDVRATSTLMEFERLLKENQKTNVKVSPEVDISELANEVNL